MNPETMIRPRRRITGISAILLPFTSAGDIDWPAFERHVARTAEAGLTPAVNMDTGYVNLLEEDTRRQVLLHTQQVLAGGPFVAGAFVGDRPDSSFDRTAYLRQMESVRVHGGMPVVFPSYGLTSQEDDALIASYAALGHAGGSFIAFELGSMFAPFGKIYSLEVYKGLLGVKECLGAKHSSLDRVLEWQRLALRDLVRPDFRVFTGNDLAIDMVIYGSDYLLGLSTFAPDLFALRDRFWEQGDPAFYQLNDVLQYLGFFAFRNPVPAYKHSAAQFLYLRGWAGSDRTHTASPTRRNSDVEVLREIARQLGIEASKSGD